MYVEIDDSTYSLGVFLDDGTEVGRYCIVEDSEGERKSLETMIRKCCEEYEKRKTENRAIDGLKGMRKGAG